MPVKFECDYCGKDLGAEWEDWHGWNPDPAQGDTYFYRQKPQHYKVILCNTADENDGCWFLFRRRENIELYHPEHGGEPYYRKLF